MRYHRFVCMHINAALALLPRMSLLWVVGRRGGATTATTTTTTTVASAFLSRTLHR